jgi:TIR domain
VLFISHSSTDKPFVQRLAIDLLGRGIDVWLDGWELELGDQLTPNISSAIEHGDCLLLVLSPAAVRSRWVDFEVDALPLVAGESFVRLLTHPTKGEQHAVPTTAESTSGKQGASIPADPPRVEEIVAVMRRAGERLSIGRATAPARQPVFVRARAKIRMALEAEVLT